MKKQSINLLPNSAKLQVADIRIMKTVKRFCLIAAGFFALIAIATNIFYLIKIKQRTASEKDLQTASAQLKQLEEKIGLQQGIRFRLKLLADVLKNRSQPDSELRQIKEYLPSSAEITEFQFNRGKWSLDGALPDIISLDQLERAAFRLKDIKNNVQLKNVTKGQLGTWRFSLEIN